MKPAAAAAGIWHRLISISCWCVHNERLSSQDSFLDTVTSRWNKQLCQMMLPSGKASVFDSLHAALAWFRPGKLTNELLRKLGQWVPEFMSSAPRTAEVPPMGRRFRLRATLSAG